MLPRLKINLANHLTTDSCDFTYGCDGYDMPVFNVNHVNRLITVSAYTDNELFELDIQLPNDELYDLHVYNSSNKIKLTGTARFNLVIIKKGNIEIANGCDITFNAMQVDKCDLLNNGKLAGKYFLVDGGKVELNGSMTIQNQSVISASSITMNSRIKLGDAILIAEQILRISEHAYIDCKDSKIYAASCFCAGNLVATYAGIEIERILFLAQKSHILAVGDLTLSSAIIDYQGEIISIGKLESRATVAHRFGAQSNTSAYDDGLISGRSLVLDGIHDYKKFDMCVEESLDFGLSTNLKAGNDDVSTLRARNIHTRGKMTGVVAAYGAVIVNEATMVEGRLKIHADIAAVNTELANTNAEKFSMHAKKVFAEGKMSILGKCKFVSETSTYLSEKLAVKANKVVTTGQGSACIDATINAKESVKSHHNGAVVISKSSDVSAKKIRHIGDRVTVSGKSDTKEITVVAKSYADITEDFSPTSSIKTIVHSSEAYRVAAKLTTAEVILSGKAGHIDKNAAIDAKKAVFAEGAATVSGSFSAEILHLSQAQGSFAVAKTGDVKYQKEFQGVAQSVYLAGKLRGAGESPSAVKATSFVTESASQLHVGSPLFINAATASLQGESSHNKTVITSVHTNINTTLNKGELIIVGEGDSASARIGAAASLDNDKLAVTKIKNLAVAGNVGSKEVHIDAKDVHISQSGVLGQNDSSINGKMDTLSQLGEINGKSANLQIERYYIQNALRHASNTHVHALKVTVPLYVNLLGRRNTNSTTFNTLIPFDSGILQGNFIISNALLLPPTPLLIIPNLFNLYKELKRIWSEGITSVDTSYFQVASQTVLLFLRTTHPLLASVTSVGLNSYFLSANFKQLSQHKLLKGEPLTNAEWLDLLVLIKNMILSIYAIGSEVNASYEAVNKALIDEFYDIKDYFTNHFLKDVKDIEEKAINFGKHLYYDGRDAWQGLLREHPKPSGQSREVLRDGRVCTETPYLENDIENAALDHPGDKVMLDTNGRSILVHDTANDVSRMQQCLDYLNHQLEELQDWAHITRTDLAESVESIDRTSLCHAFQRAMPLISAFVPSVYSDSILSLPFFNSVFSGVVSRRSLFHASRFSNTFAFSQNIQAFGVYDYNNPYVINASYRGRYVYLNESFYVPIFSVSANKFEQGKSARIGCYMQTEDIPHMKKYRVNGVVNNYIYETVEDERGFLQLSNQWRDYRNKDVNFEANYTTNHKLNLDNSFILPWKASFTATEILVPTGVTVGSKKQITLCSTKGSIVRNGVLIGSKIIEDSADKIIQHGGSLYAAEMYQHARNGISQTQANVIAGTGYQLSDHGNITNHQSQIRFAKLGYVNAVRGVVDQYQGCIKGGNGAPYNNIGLIVHGGQGVSNHMGAIGADAQSVIIGDNFIRGVATQHHGRIDRPEFYSNHGSVVLISRYGSLDSLCGHYRGKEGIYFDLRDAPTFRGINFHEKHHHTKRLFGLLPVKYEIAETNEHVSQLFSTQGVISFRVKYHDLVIPDSSLIAQQLITDIWNGSCYFPQTPIDHDDRSVSLTFGGNLAFINFDYDEKARIFAALPVIDSLKSINKSNNPLQNGLGLLGAMDEAAGLYNGYMPTVGVHAGLKREAKHYQTPNHTIIQVGLWLDYSRGIHVGDVQGHIGKLVMFCGSEFSVSGAFYRYDSNTQQCTVGLSYNLLTQQPGISASVGASSQHGGYYHSSRLTVGRAVFHRQVNVLSDQADINFIQTTGEVQKSSIAHHASASHVNGLSVGVSARGIESIGIANNHNNVNVRRLDSIASVSTQHRFFSQPHRESSRQSSIYNVPNNRQRDCFDNPEQYRTYVSHEADERHHHLHPHLLVLKEWRHLAKYLTDIKHPYFKKSLIVYRGDARPPKEILHDGFNAKGKNPSILSHLNPNGGAAPHDSLYVSTTLNSDYAKSFPRNAVQDGFAKSYVYKISAPESAFDIHAEVKKLNLPHRDYLRYAMMRHELEYVIPRHVPVENILGYYEVTSYYFNGKVVDISMADFVKNPALQTRWYHGLITGERVMTAGGYIGSGMAIGVEYFEFKEVCAQAKEVHSFHPIGEHLSGVRLAFPLACSAGTRVAMCTVAVLEAGAAGAIATAVMPVTLGTIASTAVYCAAKPIGGVAYRFIFEPRKTYHEVKQSTFKFFKEVADHQPYANPLMYPPLGYKSF